MEKVEKVTNNNVVELLKIMNDREKPLDKEDYVYFIEMEYSLKDIIEALIIYNKQVVLNDNEPYIELAIDNINNAIVFMCDYLDASDINNMISQTRLGLYIKKLQPNIQEDLIYIDFFLGSISSFEVLYKFYVEDEGRFNLQRKLINFNRTYLVDSSTILANRPEIYNEANLSLLSTCSSDFIKKGDLFGIRAIDLLAINFYEENKEDEDLYGFITQSLINYASEFKNKVLLLCYLGNNQCLEFYSQKIVNVDRRPKFIARIYDENSYSFATKSFAATQVSPLVIDEESKFFDFDKKFKNQLLSQDGEESSKIAERINMIYNYYMEKNKEKIGALQDRCYEEAQAVSSLEMSIAEFKKLAKTRIDNNQE